MTHQENPGPKVASEQASEPATKAPKLPDFDLFARAVASGSFITVDDIAAITKAFYLDGYEAGAGMDGLLSSTVIAALVNRLGAGVLITSAELAAADRVVRWGEYYADVINGIGLRIVLRREKPAESPDPIKAAADFSARATASVAAAAANKPASVDPLQAHLIALIRRIGGVAYLRDGEVVAAQGFGVRVTPASRTHTGEIKVEVLPK
jgi:hypothetical protein